MSEGTVLALSRDTITTILFMAGPVMAAGLITGLVFSIFQAVTQIQEQTLTFVPKIIVVFLTLLLMGSYMLNTINQFAANIFGNLNGFIR